MEPEEIVCSVVTAGKQHVTTARDTHSACHLLSRWYLLGLFDPEYAGDTFLWNVGRLSSDHVVISQKLCCSLIARILGKIMSWR
jgi:hypothetical protein